LTATNASELAQALIEVSVVEKPEPIILEITLNAQEGEGGPIIDAGLVLSLTNVEMGNTVVENALTAQLVENLEAGMYFAEVLRTSDEATAELQFAAMEGGARSFTLTLPFALPEATIVDADTAIAGSTISMSWTVPSGQNDYITITEVFADLMAPKIANAEESIALMWMGPDYQNDYISIAEIGSDSGRYINYSYTREGSPLRLEMPAEAGTYEIRYIMNQDHTVLARHRIELAPVSASLTTPANADAGSKLIAIWDGPDYHNDHISIARVGDDDSQYENYEYVRNGSPLLLELPEAQGDYKIRYVMKQDRTVLARTPITVGG